MKERQDTTAAATDVGEFVTDLDGGHFDHMLSVALSKVAAAVIDHDPKKGKVCVELAFERIGGTTQVRIAHIIKFAQPTGAGRLVEEATGATVMHVGRFGRLTLSQGQLIGKQGEVLP